MRLVRTVPRPGALPELRTYACRACGIYYTAEDPQSSLLLEQAERQAKARESVEKEEAAD